MKKPSLIYYDVLRYRPENKKLLEDNFRVIGLPDPSHDTPEILCQADVILAPLGYFMGREKMDQSPALKVIGSNTTGDRHIDVDYAREKGIKVVTLKGRGDFLKTITPTAELTWGLIIALTRNMVPAFHSVLNGHWERWPFGGERMLSKMTLGVVGLGRLGSMVASYGLHFGMGVRYYDPYVSESPIGVERVETLKKLVEASDIVTLHIPYESETEKLINREVFACFKNRAFLVNTSSGDVVDQQSLLESLESGKLAGAATDVLGGEFNPEFHRKVFEHPLVRYAATHTNLIITPHIGGSTIDAWSLTQQYTIRKVLEAIE
jgi:D-3-phosphoglycerate dehydrogenase